MSTGTARAGPENGLRAFVEYSSGTRERSDVHHGLKRFGKDLVHQVRAGHMLVALLELSLETEETLFSGSDELAVGDGMDDTPLGLSDSPRSLSALAFMSHHESPDVRFAVHQSTAQEFLDIV